MADDSVEGAHLECHACGRPRWQGDRFCAECGAEFASGTTTGAGGGIIDVDGLTVRGAESDATSNWRDGLKGLGVLALVVGLLIGGLFLASAGDEPDEEAGVEEVDLDGDPAPTRLPATPVPDTPVPPTPTEEPDAGAPPTPPPVPGPTPAAVAEALVGLDAGARWFFATNSRGDVIAHDIETGELHEIARGRALGERLLLSDGMIEITFGSEDAEFAFESWSSTGDAVEIDGGLVGAFVDRDVGRVFVTSPDAFGADFTATAFETGESRSITLQGSLLGSGFQTFLGAVQAAAPPAFIVNVEGQVWIWTWADGWDVLIDGEAQFVGPDLVVVRKCPDPQSCEFSIVDYDGRVLVGDVPWTLPEWASLSPDGQTIASVVPPSASLFAPQQESLFLIDVESGDSVEIDVSVSFGSMFWSPNSRYLIVVANYGSGKSAVVDAIEGQVVGEYPGRQSVGFFETLAFADNFVPPDDSQD